MPTEQQLFQGLAAADKAGNAEDAQKFASAIRAMRNSEQLTHSTTAPVDERVFNPNIDKTGLPFGLAKDVLAGDNETERLSALREDTGRSSTRSQRRGEQGRREARLDSTINSTEKFPNRQLFRDISGREYTQLEDGKKVYVEPYGEGITSASGWRAGGQRMGEQIAARPFEVTGAVAGGPAGIGRAGAGASAGYLIDQAVKASRDRYHKTPGELAVGTAQAGAMGAGGEAIARVPGALMRGGLPEWFTGATQESKDLTREVVGKGGRPEFTSAGPSMKAAQWKVDFARKLGLNPDESNTHAIMDLVSDFLGKHGVTDVDGTVNATKTPSGVKVGGEAGYGTTLKVPMQQARANLANQVGVAEKELSDIEQINETARLRAQQKLSDVQQRATDAATGEKRALTDAQKSATGQAKEGVAGAKGQVQEAKSAQQIEFDRNMATEKIRQDNLLAEQMKAAQGEAERSLNTLRSGRGRPAQDLQATVAGDVRNWHQANSNSFQARYSLLDRMESGLESEMDPLSSVASRILESIPRGPDGNPIAAVTEEMAPRLKMLEQLRDSAGMKLPVGQMAALRTSLYQLGGTRSLLGSTKQHLIDELYKAADMSVKNAMVSKAYGDGLLSPVEQAARLDKIQKVRLNIEKDYAAFKKKGGDALLERLTKDAGTRGSIDAESVVPLATSSPNQFRRIYNIVSPETRRRISRGVFDDMVGRSTRGGSIDAQAFVDQLKGNMSIMKQVFGSDAPKIIEAANGLLAVNGKVPLGKRGVMPENVVSALKTATKTQKEMDDYFSKHSLALMAKGDAAQDRAIQEAKLWVAKKKEELAGVGERNLAEKRGLEDKTSAEKQELARRIESAGRRVSDRAEQRISLGKEKVSQAKEKLKDFDHDYFGQMANEKFLAEGAVDHIIQSGKGELLDKAVQLYGPGSPQVKSLQEAFMRKVVASGTNNIGDNTAAFSGQGIRDFLGRYSQKQKDILLEPFATTRQVFRNNKWVDVHMNGEESLKHLADAMDHAFPKDAGDMSAGLAAGATKAKVGPTAIFNPKAWPALWRYGSGLLEGMLLTNPQVVKYLVAGVDHGPKAEAALKAFDTASRAYVQSSAAQKKNTGSPGAMQ